MTTEEIQYIRKIQKTLQEIENGVPVFFNISQYERLGLVSTKNKWATNAVGNKIKFGHTFHLTAKAKKYLNVII